MIDYLPLWARYEEDWQYLSDEEVGELVRAGLRYLHVAPPGGTPGISEQPQYLHVAPPGGTPGIQGAGRFVWPAFKRDIDFAIAQYEKRANAGRSGGQASRSKPKQNQANRSEPEQPASKPKQTEANHNHNQNHNHTSAADAASARAREAAAAVIELFSAIRPERAGFIPDKAWTLAEVLAGKYPMETVRQGFEKSKAPFLNGGGTRGFVADVCWIMQDEHFQDILAGKYDATHRKGEKQTAAAAMTERVSQGSAGLGWAERDAIRRMLEEEKNGE